MPFACFLLCVFTYHLLCVITRHNPIPFAYWFSFLVHQSHCQPLCSTFNSQEEEISGECGWGIPKWCTLHSPPFSDGFRWTFTEPSQFQRTQRTVRRTSNGFRWTWPNSAACLAQVRGKSGEVTLKQKIIGLAGLASLADFHWTSVGLPTVLKAEKRKNMTSPQSARLLLDFQLLIHSKLK